MFFENLIEDHGEKRLEWMTDKVFASEPDIYMTIKNKNKNI